MNYSSILAIVVLLPLCKAQVDEALWATFEIPAECRPEKRDCGIYTKHWRLNKTLGECSQFYYCLTNRRRMLPLQKYCISRCIPVERDEDGKPIKKPKKSEGAPAAQGAEPAPADPAAAPADPAAAPADPAAAPADPAAPPADPAAAPADGGRK